MSDLTKETHPLWLSGHFQTRVHQSAAIETETILDNLPEAVVPASTATSQPAA